MRFKEALLFFHLAWRVEPLFYRRQAIHQFHGNLFWFTSRRFCRPILPQPRRSITLGRKFVQNIYGGSLGGPIWKDRAFFFADVKLLRSFQ